ncbi:MAG TPA: putative nucleotidyltransferase substrate binding domain-containing protein [Microlunatus sp.]|nr:putative nucleotidyltransferase substrate binding domain-containing protein [Microlunatus sp.]
MDPAALQAFLRGHPPFATLDPAALAAMATAARVEQHAAGDLLLDAFLDPSVEMYVVVEGEVDVWFDRDRILESADERLGPGAVFGFSAMLTERSVGPRVVAVGDVTTAAIPAAVVEPALTSPDGARFLAEHLSAALRRTTGARTYSLVDELIATEPLVVSPTDTAYEVARQMTERGAACAVVDRGGGRFGLVTDAVLRERLIVQRMPDRVPVAAVMESTVPTVRLGASAAEALILLLESEAEFLPVLDAGGRLCGVVEPRDFAVSPTTAGVSLHEQLRRAASTEELSSRARQLTGMLQELLSRGLTSSRVIAVYSGMLDTVMRRAIQLVFGTHPELSVDAFTWLSLGSNGRREAVPSSDVDTAVAFVDGLPSAEFPAYRAAFGEVHAVLADAGLSSDHHGATAPHPAFSRTNAEWRAAGREWMAAPHKNRGAVMASLLVDGRPIYGDPGLSAVARVFSDLRQHRGTMRLLLHESLSHRAKLHSMLDVLTRRAETFDIKAYALLPIVNLARWAALAVGSSVLPTTERLRAVSGSEMLPAEQADHLIEAFDVLQRLRVRYQLLQLQRGEAPSDLLTLDRLSPIDRSVVTQAVREIAAVQRRMDNVSLYVPIGSWTSPTGS